MTSSIFTRALAALLVCLAANVQADESPTGANVRVALNIKAQPVREALQAFGEQTGLQVLFRSEGVSVEGVKAASVSGELPAGEALTKMLAKTGLKYEFVNDKTVRVAAAQEEMQKANAVAEGSERPLAGARAQSESPRAQEASDKSQTDSSVSAGTDGSDTKLEEIVVTAQKREERLMDVPSAVSAISGERLELLNVTSLSDLSAYVPGLSVNSIGSPGLRNVIIRGVAAGYLGDLGGPLVGTYIDDLPINTSTASGRGSTSGLDLLPYDVDHVEVLKGPQGTLYGGNAMGGLIKYSLRRPNLTDFDAQVGASSQYTRDSDSPDWGLRAALNMPLVSQKLGLRLSGFNQTTAGYIDNIGTGDDGANHSTQKGGRAALLWQATDDLSIQTGFLLQKTDIDDLTFVTLDGTTREPLFGRQVLSTFFPQRYAQETRNYSLSINWNLGFASLSSASGWSRLEAANDSDYSVPYGLFARGNSDDLALYKTATQAKKFVQEIRLSSVGNKTVEWMLGGYYTKEDTAEQDTWPTFTSSYAPLPYNLYILDSTGLYKERAAFANVTYKINDRFDVSAGGRYSSYKQSIGCSNSTGPFGSGFHPCLTTPSKEVPTWMGNARFHVTEDAMLYARVATGYRPGVSNLPVNIQGGVPPQSNADKTTSYEAGLKAQMLGRRLTVDASIFDIKWRDIQTQINDGGLVYVGNGGRAETRGAEFTTGYLFPFDLQLNATLAYTDAFLAEDAPSIAGKDGDRLPASPRWAGSFTADYRRPIGASATLMFGGAYRYKDAVVSQFPSTGLTAPLPPQNMVDLHAGIEFARLGVQLYGQNVFDDESYAGLTFIADPTRLRYVPVLPRTFGIRLDYRFGNE
jgi:outer membrane receptor protein involved in Fe transport